MQGESPLNLMRPQRQRGSGGPAAAAAPPRRRVWTIVAAVVLLVAICLGWSWLWYYAASVTDRTLAGWVQREAAAGRIYTCGSQGISGFPFSIEVHCDGAAAELPHLQPPFAATARDVTFAAQVYHPTVLVGDIAAPVTLAEPGRPPSFIANWSRAQISVRGLPPEPDSLGISLDQPRVDQVTGTNGTIVFKADHAEVQSGIVGGSARNKPVIDTVVRFAGASAPTVHPLLADPPQGDGDIVVRGLSNLLPKPWPARFREMQAAGGNIELKHLRIDRPDSTVIASGTLTINEHGKLDGLISVAVAGIDHIVPLIGVDQLIGQGIDRLAGSTGQPGQGLNALDRLLPGLSGAVRQGANATVIDNLKKMGQPTEIDKKPAIILPLRVSDGSV